MSKKYVIRITDTIGGVRRTEYIGNGTYTVNGAKYAVLLGADIDKAKRYTSHKRAKNAIEKLKDTCENLIGSYEIEEVEQ